MYTRIRLLINVNKNIFLGSGSGHQSGVGSGKDGDGLDVMSTIKDPNIKEIVAKESLQVWRINNF